MSSGKPGKRSWAGWFPVLVAIAFPITVYSHNQAAFAAAELWRPVVVFGVIAYLLVVVLRQWQGRDGLAELLACALMLSVWFLGAGFAFAFAAGLIVLAGVLLRGRLKPRPLFPVFDAMALGLLILPLLSIYQVRAATDAESLAEIPWSPFTQLAEEDLPGERPDIYHIVLDAYGGETSLRDVLGFDNSAFFDALTEMGFVVNRSIHVPYNETVHTMSAIFLGDFLQPGEFPVDAEVPTTLRSTMGALIPAGPVHEFLRHNGYDILFTETGHDFLRFPDSARVLRSDVSGWRLTRFEDWLGVLMGVNRYAPGLFAMDAESPMIRALRSALAFDYSRYASPKFVYQHMLAPHTPFTIDRDGEPTDRFPGFENTAEGDSVVRNDPRRRALYKEGYLEKLHYVNDRLLPQLAQILAAPEPKVVFVHGDHGSGSLYWMDQPERTCLKERFVSFLAVYTNVPALAREYEWVTDEQATLVNLYRSLMNGMAGTELAPLPARSSFVRFFSPHQLLPVQAEAIARDCI